MRLVYLTLGWVSGLICAAQIPELPPLFWLIALGVTTFTAYIGFHTRWRWLLLVFCAIALGGWRYMLLPQTSPLVQFHELGSATVTGIVQAEPDRRDHVTLLRVASEIIEFGMQPQATSGLMLVEAPIHSQVRYGDRIRISGAINQPAIFDTFSYADYLARDSVFTIMQNTQIEILSSGHGNPLFAALIDARESLALQISRQMPEPQAGLLAGILLGQERMIAPEIAEAFARTGTAHIIAISGFNMAVIAGILMATLGRLIPNRSAAIWISLGLIALYTLFVGANAAVVRAAVMSSIVILGGHMKRRAYLPAAVAGTVLVMSMWHPTILWNVSFQLSLAAVLGITIFVAPLNRYYDRVFSPFFRNPLLRATMNFLREPLVVTIAAMIATTPIIVLYFQRISLITVIVNMIVIPVQPMILFLGGAATLVFLIVPAVGQLLYWLTLIPLSWTTSVIRSFAIFPYAELSASIPAWVVFCIYALFLGGIMSAARPYWLERWTNQIRRRSIVLMIAAAGFSLVVLLVAVMMSRPDGLLHVWWLNVGHSNAVLIQTPGGAHILIDGGQYPSRLLTSIGDRLPFYDRRLEVVVISQLDEYDIGALPAVLDRYEAGVVLNNGQTNFSESYALLERALARSTTLTVQAGYTLETSDGVKIEILSPQRQPQVGDSINEHALVLRVSYQDASLLLPGDLSRSAQETLVNSGVDLHATVLQIPQHGTVASLSQSFLEVVQPQVAIIQADPANRRGDPHLDTLYQIRELQVFRTDEDGALHLWTDGNALWILPENAD